jgi:putative phosphoesterase
MRIGLISDTHGFLHGKVFDLFADTQYILHAGDIGDDRILDELETIAPVFAVSGNVDGAPTTRRPLTYTGELAGVRIAMTHGHLLDPRDYNESATEMFRDYKPRIIIHGHSHRARNDMHEDINIINPGAACKPRFRDVPSVAILEIEPRGTWFVQFHEIKWK